MPYLAPIALIVGDYDEAVAFYIGKLGFTLVEDIYQRAGRTLGDDPPAERASIMKAAAQHFQRLSIA